ncbi:MAG: hypothetical protein ACI9KE_002763 [Polyangiales bacterium]
MTGAEQTKKVPSTTHGARCAASLLALFALACGSKTPLEEYEFELDGGTLECFRAQDCMDGVSCSVADCQRGVCVYAANDDFCALDLECSVRRCDLTSGCVSDPVRCDDGIECTVDACEEPLGCAHEPDDRLCPVSTRCDVDEGCVARAFVHDESGLWSVDLPSGRSERVANFPVFTDIALGPDGTLYAVDFAGIYTYDRFRGFAELIIPTDRELVALDIGPDGALYGAALDDEVVRYEVESGRQEVVGRFPPGWVSSGDIAFVGSRLLATISDNPASMTAANALCEIMPDGRGEIIGLLGQTCLWGLAAFGSELYGFSCSGGLYSIDSESGDITLLTRFGFPARGAAAR